MTQQPIHEPVETTNPDPKAHPIHAPIPVQPIHEGTHEGTDPVKPVNPDPKQAT